MARVGHVSPDMTRCYKYGGDGGVEVSDGRGHAGTEPLITRVSKENFQRDKVRLWIRFTLKRQIREHLCSIFGDMISRKEFMNVSLSNRAAQQIESRRS